MKKYLKKYMKKYYQKPEVKERERERKKTLEYKEYQKEYQQKNEEKRKLYYQNNKERIKLRVKEYNKKYTKEEIKEKNKKYYQKYKGKKVEATKKIKLQVYNHYSNYDIKCNCCGEREIGFLSLDHINNDGYKHRKIHLTDWLYRNNFPIGFQILCMNCNHGRMRNPDKICPHQIKKAEQILN